MKQGLSKREKILIVLLAVIALVYGTFQFGISPAYRSYNEKKEELENVTYEKKLIDINTRLSSLENINP